MRRRYLARISQYAPAFGRLLWELSLAALLLTCYSSGEVRNEMLVSTEWLANHLHDDGLVILCVVEDERFYSTGHIPGARMLRLSEIVTTHNGIPNELPSVEQLQHAFERAAVSNGSRIILYGERSGLLAARAYFTLDYLGLAARAALLDGGIEKWRSEERPESVEEPGVMAGGLEVRVHPEIVVDTPRMAEYSHTISNSNAVVLIDARPHPEYTGERLSEDVSKAGHIPHATSLYWREMLQKSDLPELRPAAELKKLFQVAGASDGKEVVTYCRTGMQSSFDYFVAKYLGYKAQMYDASFYEWSLS